jgi:8-oxo-dGTP pyrophosphatase MutT (NUDIX family)
VDEDPLEGAKRELAEETGLVADEWRQVLKVQLSNSVTDERAVGFVALGLREADTGHQRDDSEDLQLARVPFRELLAACLAGHIEDALTVAMTLRAYHMAREGELPDDLARAMLG